MIKVSTLLIFFSFFFNSCTTAQHGNYTTKNKKAIKLYEQGLDAFRKAEYDGPDYLTLAKGYLKKSLDKDENFVDAYMLLSEVNYRLGDLKTAIELKEKGLLIKPEYSQNEYFYLSNMQFYDLQYDKAINNAQKFLTFRNTNPALRQEANRIIKNSEFAKEAIKNPVPFDPKNLGGNINTEASEYHPTILGDESQIIFTRTIKDERVMNSRGIHEDLYTSIKSTDGEWQISNQTSNKINTLMNEGSSTISADGNYLIFTSCAGINGYGETRTGRGSCDLFYCKKIGKRWSRPKNLGAEINTKYWESQPCFSADGRTIYFIRRISREANRKKQDIYVTYLNDDGSWTKPERMPNHINTTEAEQTVFIHPDGQTLYFASDGHIGMGGLDLFVSRKQSDGTWGAPENLGYPINTPNDEDGIIVSPDGTKAYFASTREGGFGLSDIYYFELPENLRPTLTTYMKGKVFDGKSKIPLGASIELIDLDKNEVIFKSKSNDLTGDFLVNIPTNKELAMNVSLEGYFFYSKNYTFKEKENKNEPFLVDVPLNKIEVDDKGFVLENVFFDVNKYELKPKSKIELNKLYNLLNQNGSLKVELGGHTDSDGDDKKNQILSENRAKAVVTYLVEKGIKKDRLTYKGYGEKKPLVENSSPENKAKNRRTEVKIIEK